MFDRPTGVTVDSLNLQDSPLVTDERVQENRYALLTRGYAVIDHILLTTTCVQLKDGLESALRASRSGNNQCSILDRYHIHDLLCRNLMFGRLLEDPRLQQLLAPVLGEHWVMYAFTSSSLPPGESNRSRRIHVDSPRQHPGYVFNAGVIWALDEFTADNGGTEFLPGSQHLAEPPSEAFFERNCVQIRCARGSMILFDARVYHRSGENRTGEWRHALTMNACRSFMKQRMDWVRFVPAAIAEQLTEQARRILGFHTRMPTSLDDFYVPDSQRLYRANQG